MVELSVEHNFIVACSEGFLRFPEAHCRRQGICDERESALSPARQIGLLKLKRWMDPVIARSSWPCIRPC
jgi:predicted ATPase